MYLLRMFATVQVAFLKANVIEVMRYNPGKYVYIPTFVSLQVKDTMLEDWLFLLNDALTNHGYELDMQEAGCRCLARVLEIRPYLIEMIGNDKERYQ